jgi:DNA transformation protein
MAKRESGFKDFILDQLADLRQVTTRAMFGGHGLYHGAKFFGIIHKDRLYFKVTPETVGRYTGKGMKPFRPNAKQTLKSFYEVPIDVLEDTEQVAAWAVESSNR